MDSRERGYVGRIGIVCLLLLWCAGCRVGARPRHGLILRGDWSLELNRVPWLTNRTEAHQESSYGTYPARCVPEGEACTQDGCGPTGPAVVSPEIDDLSGPAPGGLLRRICRRLWPGAGAVQPASAAEYRRPRFHPVPSRPVFLPQSEGSMHVGGNAVLTGAESADRNGLPASPAPMPPGTEVVPAPAPQPAADAGYEDVHD